MRRMGIAGSRRLIDRGQTYQAHQPANPVTADAHAFAAQLARHLTRAVDRILQEQLVDAPHQHQGLQALAPIGAITGCVVERGSADRQQPALTAQAHIRVVALDHRLAFNPAHRLSPPAKKSRSTVSWPILAWRSWTSAS
jgi:hypothetical protein